MNERDYETIADAARLLKVPLRTFYNAVAQRKFKTRKLPAGKVLVYVPDARRWDSTRQKRAGRPNVTSPD